MNRQFCIYRCFLYFGAHKLPGDTVKNANSDLAGLSWDPSFPSSKKLRGDARATGPEPTNRGF